MFYQEAKRWLICSTIALCFAIQAESSNPLSASFANLEIAEASKDQPLVILPTQPGNWINESDSVRSFTLEVRETSDRRKHTVFHNGKTITASTPIEGTRSRIAYDPSFGRFVGLLPSIRVEWVDGVDPHAIAAATGALKLTEFKQLGYFVLELPRHLHPAAAIQHIQTLPGQPKAFIRTRGFDIEWR